MANVARTDTHRDLDDGRGRSKDMERDSRGLHSTRIHARHTNAGSNPVAPTSEGRSGQRVPAGLFSDLGTRSDLRAELRAEISPCFVLSDPFLCSLIRGCSHPLRGSAERDPPRVGSRIKHALCAISNIPGTACHRSATVNLRRRLQLIRPSLRRG